VLSRTGGRDVNYIGDATNHNNHGGKQTTKYDRQAKTTNNSQMLRANTYDPVILFSYMRISVVSLDRYIRNLYEIKVLRRKLILTMMAISISASRPEDTTAPRRGVVRCA